MYTENLYNFIEEFSNLLGIGSISKDKFFYRFTAANKYKRKLVTPLKNIKHLRVNLARFIAFYTENHY